jgi:hypothetical protein
MPQSLPQVAHTRQTAMLQRVDALPAMADNLLTSTTADGRLRLDEVRAFLTTSLLPHMDTTEQAIYPELERMFQNRHSMAPMRREHAEIRRLVSELAAAAVDPGALTLGRTLAVRRIVFQLYALLKVHLAEEDVYLRIAERGVTPDVADVLAAVIANPMARV